MASQVVIVAKYLYEHEADLARVALEAEGIQAAILADSAGGMLPSLGYFFPVRLAVHESDADLAREILAQLKAGPSVEAPEEE